MKTCSFAGAHPRSSTEGFFCGETEPEAKYTMVQCDDTSCECCYIQYTDRPKHFWSIVDFESSSSHRFLNGYTSYLNCPAVRRLCSCSLIYIYARIDDEENKTNLI